MSVRRDVKQRSDQWLKSAKKLETERVSECFKHGLGYSLPAVGRR